MSFLSNYGLFFLEVFTLVIAILATFAGLVAIGAKSKNRPSLNIRQLNERYLAQKEKMQLACMSKKEFKAYKKCQKAELKAESDKALPRLFVVNFVGDIKASAVESLRQEVSAILSVASPKDEVLVNVESGGGTVNSYGLAASQLQRITSNNIPLTVAVDKIAASGGYLMASVANKILAAPFAVVGSIGVVSQMPNFNKWLKKHDIDYEMFTAGEYKRTVTMFGENDDEDRAKYTEELEQTHELFKHFVTTYRPKLDLAKVANGDHWYGEDALKLNLVDELSTSDAYLLQQMEKYQAYALLSRQKPTFAEKLGLANAAHSAVSGVVSTATKSALTALGDTLPEVMSKIEQDKRLKF